MKKILITGKNSYIGTSVEKWLTREPDNYQVDTISLKDNTWREKDFSEYDVVFHVAGIAHVSSDPKMEDLYYKVNRDLTIETAKKAKAEGVKQFIFMSSIIVYGDSSSSKSVINKNTIPNPSNFYGDSKLQAEEGIKPLETDDFKVAIIRPPMIYGKGSKGNYPKLSKLARIIPFFPSIDNKLSILHINNLVELIRIIIENTLAGYFHPQNAEYTSTSKLISLIGNNYDNNIKLFKVHYNLIKILKKNKYYLKIFGSRVYSKELSNKASINYQIINLEDSIKETELK